MNDNVYGAVIVTRSLREFTRRMQTSASARRPQTRPTDLGCEPASPPVGCYMAYIHYRHLLLLSSKADTFYSYVPRRVEG